MSLQSLFLNVQSFFNYLFETITMRNKPEYTPVYEEELDQEVEILNLFQSMTMER
jgi:hypothetical protein